MSNAYPVYLSSAPASARVAYLQRVLLWTTGGLLLAAVTGSVSAVVLYLVATSCEFAGDVRKIAIASPYPPQ